MAHLIGINGEVGDVNLPTVYQREPSYCPVLAGSLSGSDENIQNAGALGVRVISPVLGKVSEDKLGLDEFNFFKDCRLDCVVKLMMMHVN